MRIGEAALAVGQRLERVGVEHLAARRAQDRIAGRRVLVSRKWSNKSLSDHRAERTAFVRQLLDRAGVKPAYAVDDGPFTWETTGPGDTDVPPRQVLLLHAINQRQRWRADYDAALMAAADPPGLIRSANESEAA